MNKTKYKVEKCVVVYFWEIISVEIPQSLLWESWKLLANQKKRIVGTRYGHWAFCGNHTELAMGITETESEADVCSDKIFVCLKHFI